VNCTVVREALPEFALGVADEDETSSIELHVETCAACRKEAFDLQHAASAFGYALAPLATPEPELEDRVVDAVRVLARPSRPARMRGKRAGALLLAAAIVVAGIGVGSVFAGRVEHQRLQQERDQLARDNALAHFAQVASQLDPGSKVLTGTLDSKTGVGTGAALTLVSPAVEDRLVVIVSDLGDRALPLSVSISDTSGHTFDVGEIKHLDTSGGATFASIVGTSLRNFVEVVVRDAKDHVALRGTLAAESTVASPSP
jgi:anti-sigma factor RsiW